ncbi:MAG: PD-(D/E)XK nuclease family protein [Bacilli bacterium]|nr:PD-(D/E)XK nuclease family protein [Bacilli bacterium]
MNNIDLSLLENSVVVAPRELHDSFLSLKGENPYLNFSLMDRDELISLFLYKYDDRAIEELILGGHLYNEAKKKLKVFASPNAENVLGDEDKETRETLIKEYLLYRNAYPEITFKGKNVLVFGYTSKALIEYYLRDVEDVNLVYFEAETCEKPCRNLLTFKDIYEEVHYLFNAIAEDLSSGTSINDIYVVGASGDYDILFEEFSRHYGFEIEHGVSLDLSHSSTFKRFLALSSDKKPTDTFPILEEEGYPIEDIEAIEKIVLRWNGVIKVEELEMLLYREIATTKNSFKPSKGNIVRRLDSFVAPSGSHLYLVNFSMGTYPPVYEEDSYIDDEKCKILGYQTSEDRTKEAKQQLLALLNTPNVKQISFAAKAFGSTFFASALTKTVGLESIESPISKVEYSDDKGLIALSTLKDKYDNYLIVDKRLRSWEGAMEDDKYKSFDYKFKPFVIEKEAFKRKYSPSSIKTYSKCPFAYYLSNVLGISTYETSFYALAGQIYHDFLCSSYVDPMFDEDLSWEKSFELIQETEGYEFNELEKEILDIIHGYAKEALTFTRSHESGLEHFSAKTESSFKLPLEEGSPITITGKYDKVIEFGPEQNYYCVIDYKTGSERFDQALFQYGLSIQLPFYALYAKNDSSYDGKDLLGLFIAPLLSVPVFHKEMNKTYQQELLNSFKWDGVFLGDVGKMRALSKNDNSDLIVGLSISAKSGDFIDRSRTPGFGRIKSREQLEEMAEKAKEIVKKADENIIAGNFEIKPIEVGTNFKACEMCEFRSICFRKEDAIKRVPRIIDDEKKDDNEEEETPYGMD